MSAAEEAKEDERRKLLELISAHVGQLAEHFDNVQIFCSKVEDGGDVSLTLHKGTGNWQARYGQVKEWIIYNEAQIAHKAARDFDEDEDKP